jgi:hypothetical protein
VAAEALEERGEHRLRTGVGWDPHHSSSRLLRQNLFLPDAPGAFPDAVGESRQILGKWVVSPSNTP